MMSAPELNFSPIRRPSINLLASSQLQVLPSGGELTEDSSVPTAIPLSETSALPDGDAGVGVSGHYNHVWLES